MFCIWCCIGWSVCRWLWRREWVERSYDEKWAKINKTNKFIRVVVLNNYLILNGGTPDGEHTFCTRFWMPSRDNGKKMEKKCKKNERKKNATKHSKWPPVRPCTQNSYAIPSPIICVTAVTVFAFFSVQRLFFFFFVERKTFSREGRTIPFSLLVYPHVGMFLAFQFTFLIILTCIIVTIKIAPHVQKPTPKNLNIFHSLITKQPQQLFILDSEHSEHITTLISNNYY